MKILMIIGSIVVLALAGTGYYFYYDGAKAKTEAQELQNTATTINGRLLAQTAVTLNASAVTQPAQ